MFKGDSMYSILPIDATYFFNITYLYGLTINDKFTRRSLNGEQRWRKNIRYCSRRGQ